MLQMNKPTVKDKVLGTTHHCKKTITFLINEEKKEIDVICYFDETEGEAGGKADKEMISVHVGATHAWSQLDAGRSMGEAIRATIDGEILAMFHTCCQSTRDSIAERIEESVEDMLIKAGLD